ncbi:Eukaryotic translation initiation factor 3 subunit E [Liparis tanakae]|uniref:Eukaryotic translation initiation factor 3 subunit E n=1 Tax=Liparis tanakae TaxID=230148 RepID=A0A4Z2FW05_9TELE|nr:Eukaryotic translation initiation factor 3 subunit E [Liparis tanakae]
MIKEASPIITPEELARPSVRTGRVLPLAAAGDQRLAFGSAGDLPYPCSQQMWLQSCVCVLLTDRTGCRGKPRTAQTTRDTGPLYLNAIQTMCPHILRYLTTAIITNKDVRKRRQVLKDLVKESYTYKDPITEFVECLYVNFDFDSAQKKLRECESCIISELTGGFTECGVIERRVVGIQSSGKRLSELGRTKPRISRGTFEDGGLRGEVALGGESERGERRDAAASHAAVAILTVAIRKVTQPASCYSSRRHRWTRCLVLVNDFFLVACLEDFIENARLFIFETFCRIHQCISISVRLRPDGVPEPAVERPGARASERASEGSK